MANASQLALDDEGELDRLSLNPRKASGDAHLPLDGVGLDLCRARQRKGKKLSDVWLVLKIKPDYLMAIEEGRFEVLPGRVYAIGYVRTYAAHLGLDAEKIVARLKAEIAVRGGVKDFTIEPPPPPAEFKLPQSRTVIAGLLAAALIYSGYQVIASAGRSFEQPVIPVPERLVAELSGGIQEPAALAPARVEPPAPILPALPVPTEITVTPPAAAPTLPAPRVQTPLPPGRRLGARNRNSRITLRIHRPTQVEVRGARNRAFIDRALAPGDTYRVPNLVGLRLSAPDAGAVEIILDGTSLGFAGQDGAIARALSLNPQNIVDRQQRG